MNKKLLKGRERKMRNSRGITLIALIITIVVLLILAVVAIRAVTGDRILEYATNARDDYQASAEKENTTLQSYLYKIEANVPGGDGDGTTESVFDSITALNYGDEITYSAGGVEDWKVFYKDDNYLYIIASDYLDNSLIPSDFKMKTYGGYGIYWYGSDVFTSVGASDIEERVAKKYMLNWWSKNSTSSYNNAKVTAELLNTEVWTAKFGNVENGIEAIGSSTLEMWIASWNGKGEALGTDKYIKIYADSDENGYYIDDAENPITNKSYSINVGTGTDGYKDTMYFPYTSAIDECYGYWLASVGPSAVGVSLVSAVMSRGTLGPGWCNSDWDDGECFAARPVISIPSSLITTNADGTLAVEQ